MLRHRYGKVMLLLMIAMIILIAIVVRIQQNQVESVKQIIPIKVIVDSHVGFNLETEALNFGTMLPGTSAQRALVMQVEDDSYLTFQLAGISWVELPQDNLILRAGADESIPVTMKIPADQIAGNYTGQLVIVLYPIKAKW